VKPRARRIALIVASVPLLVSRTFRTEGTHSQIIRASFPSSSLGIPKLVPRSAAACTAWITAGCAWPKIDGPHVVT
jgi:hypothetical protein